MYYEDLGHKSKMSAKMATKITFEYIWISLIVNQLAYIADEDSCAPDDYP